MSRLLWRQQDTSTGMYGPHRSATKTDFLTDQGTASTVGLALGYAKAKPHGNGPYWFGYAAFIASLLPLDYTAVWNNYDLFGEGAYAEYGQANWPQRYIDQASGDFSDDSFTPIP